MLRSPQPNEIKINEILGPFEMKIWYVMVIFFILSLLTIATVFRNDCRIPIHDNINCWIPKPPKIKGRRYSDSVLVTIGALCQQGKRKIINCYKVYKELKQFF